MPALTCKRVEICQSWEQLGLYFESSEVQLLKAHNIIHKET